MLQFSTANHLHNSNQQEREEKKDSFSGGATSSAAIDTANKWLKNLSLVERNVNSTFKSEISSVHIKNTDFSCSTDSAAGNLHARLAFIQKVFAETVAKCPKDRPLALISLGSRFLLMEYILGAMLIKSGFDKISFFAVDPVYRDTKAQSILKEFRLAIGDIYKNTHHKTLPAEYIKFCSRAQNISKYQPKDQNIVLPKDSHQVLLEALPPYAKLLKDMASYKVKSTSLEDLMAGGSIVPIESANAVSFVPKFILDSLSTKLTDIESMPIVFLKSRSTGNLFFIDCGCKLLADGNYRISITDEEGMMPDFKKALDDMLKREISQLKTPLSQQDITALLKKIKETFATLPGSDVVECVFSADYITDRKEMLSALPRYADDQYRKKYILGDHLVAPSSGNAPAAEAFTAAEDF